MEQGTFRRAVAAASATAMAGAALVVASAGVASAQEVTESGTTSSIAGAYMSYERTVSDITPTYGDIVTLSAKIQRHGILNTATLTSMRNLHPDCFEYVDGSANWTVSGNSYSQATHPNEVKPGADYLELDPPGLWETTPFTMNAKFRVLCAAGEHVRGGLTWNSALAGQGSDSGSETVGPGVTVQRLGTSIFLHERAGAEVGEPMQLRAEPTNVPDGAEVAFSVNGQHVGNAVVANGEATYMWTPTAEGTASVQATFAQTATHGGSVSGARTIDVSEANVESSMTVVADGTPKVGESTRITATIDPAGAGGTVRFSYNGTEFDSAPVGEDGTASIDWYPSEPGQHSIDAHFTGRSGVNPTSQGLAVTVSDKDPDDIATTTVLEPLSTSAVGQEVALNATVSTGQAGGSVDFYDGADLIGTAPVQEDGTATLSWNPDADGERTIRAVFSGHDNYLASQSTTPVTITPAVVDPEPEPDPTPPADPGSGSLGSLTGSGDAGNASGSLGSLSDFGS